MHLRVKLQLDGQVENLVVLSVISRNFTLLGHYEFELCVLCDAALDIPISLGQRSTLSFSVEDKTQYFIGNIRLIRQLGKTLEGHCYFLQFVSPLELLARASHDRVFVDKTVQDRVKTLLDTANFYLQVIWKAKEFYLQDDLRIQYQENDLLFFQRQLSEWGLYYAFTSDSVNPKLQIVDAMNQFSASIINSLNVVNDTGMSRAEFSASNMVCHQRVLPQSVVCHDYNPETSNLELNIRAYNQTNLAGSLETQRYQDHFKCLKVGEQIVKLRRDAIDCQRERFTLDTNCPLIQLGQSIAINDEKFTGNYYVISVEHRYHSEHSLPYQQEQSKIPGYSNTVTLLSCDRTYRPNVDSYPKALHNTLLATIEGPSDHVFLDDQGRYRIRYFFDKENPNTCASPPVRKAEIHSGKNYGMSFPLKPGSEVIVLCQNGDIDRPIILGALANEHNFNVVTDNNCMQHVLRTHAGHQLIMDDQKNFTCVQLATPNNQEQLLLSAKKNQHQVSLLSNVGDIQVDVATTLQDTAGNNIEYTIGSDYISQSEQTYTVAAKGTIQHTVGGNVELLAEQEMKLTSEAADINQCSGNNFLIKAQNNFQLISQSDIKIQTKSGSIILQAAKSITLSAGQRITIQNGAAVITFDENGINLQGNTINFIGDTIEFDAPKVNLGGAYQAPAPQTVMPTEQKANSLQLNNISSVICNNNPTLADINIIGSCDYYQFRHDDFVRRHQGCIHLPPSYYLNYGLKYCCRFDSKLYPKLSPGGKEWLPKARLLLQKILDKSLQEAIGKMSENYTDYHHPIANELNNEEFTDFVFHTHIEAYKKAGFNSLSSSDVKKLIETLDISDDANTDTVKTSLPLLFNFGENKLENLSKESMEKIFYHVVEAITRGIIFV